MAVSTINITSSSTTTFSSIDSRIDILTKQKERFKKSQKIFEQNIYRRSCLAQSTSCCFCGCTCLGTLVPFLLCYPCNCYCFLHEKQSCYEKMLDCLGCVLFERNLENERELCCIYCTPIFTNFPEVRHHEGFALYTLPDERTNEEARLFRIFTLSKQIEQLTEKQLRSIPGSSHNKSTLSLLSQASPYRERME